MSVIILFVILFAFIFCGVPVGFAIGGATMISMFATTDINGVINAQYCYSGIFSFTVMAIPFFMLAGIVMSTGGIARRIVDFAQALIGTVTGGLGCVSIIACMFFGAISGSGMATTSAIGSMLIPEMEKNKYPVPYAVTLVCFGGIVGPIIPPSLSFVLYGSTTGVSISSLFLAGIIPGILIGILFIITNYVFCRKYNIGNERVVKEKLEVSSLIKTRLKHLGMVTRESVWALLSPVIILGGIYTGVFTPTEAACVSVVYSIIISVFVYHDMTWKGIYRAFIDAAVLNGITSFLLGYSTVFSTFMTFDRVPDMIYHALLGATDNKVVMLLIINAVLLIIGCFLDTVPAIIVMAPLLLPAVQHYGVDPLQFGVIMAINLALGLCSPPYGCNLFVGCAVGKIKMQEMFRWLVPYFLVGCVAVCLVTYIPQLSLGIVK